MAPGDFRSVAGEYPDTSISGTEGSHQGRQRDHTTPTARPPSPTAISPARTISAQIPGEISFAASGSEKGRLVTRFIAAALLQRLQPPPRAAKTWATRTEHFRPPAFRLAPPVKPRKSQEGRFLIAFPGFSHFYSGRRPGLTGALFLLVNDADAAGFEKLESRNHLGTLAQETFEGLDDGRAVVHDGFRVFGDPSKRVGSFFVLFPAVQASMPRMKWV
ncbi:MAG: hypothetical protein H7A53_11930 [Akkermansiaceae bacterium]|nr:hypothetical protein [Akkermansiaceae bacterium]